MRRFSYIDNLFCINFDLTLQEAFVLEWMIQLPSWAESEMIGNKLCFFASKNKAIADLQVVTTKVDTMYRYYKKLAEKGFIINYKKDGKDFVYLMSITKNWNRAALKSKNPEIIIEDNYSDLNPTDVLNSENNPNKTPKLGKSSENDENKSDENPTYKQLNNNSNNSKEGENVPEIKISESLKPKKKVEKLSDEVVFPIVKKCSEHFTEDVLKRLSKNDKLKWADCVEKLLRIDEFTEEQILSAVTIGRKDNFWNKNFLSLLKLRKKDKQGVKYINVFLNLKNKNGAGSYNFVLSESTEDDLL